MDGSSTRTAIVTGASAGIGAATAERLAAEGFDVILGARRIEVLSEIAERFGGRAIELDVRDANSVERFVGQIERADVLVNNAGLAVGVDPLEETSDSALETMWETNVLGLVRMTRALIPKLEAGGHGHIVNVGSTAGRDVYPGGGGYTASKHAVVAITKTLRLEFLGRPIRVTEVAPGLVETDFSLTRFGGDAEKAAKPYEGIEPLTAEDIADCIAWVVTRPPHVNIDEIVVRPIRQATSTKIARD